MVGWLKKIFGGRRRRYEPPWPRHLFVYIKGTGLGYAGLVRDQAEATEIANDVIAEHMVGKTKGVDVTDAWGITNACYWTADGRRFTPEEHEAFLAAPKELRPDDGHPPSP